MSRSDEEFKRELYRRRDAYYQRKRNKTRMILICMPLALCMAAVFVIMGFVKLADPVHDTENEEFDSSYHFENSDKNGSPKPDKTRVVQVEIQAEDQETERQYTSDEKITAVLDYVHRLSSVEDSLEEEKEEEHINYVITVTDSMGEVQTYVVRTQWQAEELETLLASLPSD